MLPKTVRYGSVLLIGLAALSFGPKLSSAQEDGAPACVNDTQRCPISKACYPSYAVCDSYDDCGTGFDELSCPTSDECDETVYDAFDDACLAESRQNGTFMSLGNDYVMNGVVTFGVPSFTTETSIWIDRVYLQWGMNSDDPFVAPNTTLTEEGYFMLKITISAMIGDGRVVVVSSTTVTLQLTANESLTSVVKKLREPLEVSVFDISNIEVLITFVRDASPSTDTPYIAPELLQFGTVEVEFVRYNETCPPFKNDNLYPCLSAAWPYLRRNGGTSCQPRERRLFVSSMYGRCISSPEIMSISSNQTGYPGQTVQIECIGTGSPLPQVNLTPMIDPESIPFFSPPSGPATSQVIPLSNGTDITFTCTAENLAGAVSSQVQVTALDYRCPILAQELVNFQQNQMDCPPVRQIETSDALAFQSYLSFRGLPDGLLQVLPLRLFSMEGEFSELPNQPMEFSFRLTVTTNQVSTGNPPRKKRDILRILYDREYRNVSLVNGGVTIFFDPPVFVAEFTDIFVNLYSPEGGPLQLPFNPIEQGPLSFLECPLSPPLNPIDNASCYSHLDTWASMEEEFIGLGCAGEVSPSFRTYETCLRIGDAQPVLTGEVIVPRLEFGRNYDIPCPIEGAVRRQWWRRTSRGDVTPYESPSPFLRFERFTASDAGYYHCEGYGGGAYRDETVATTPVLFYIEGVTTIAISATFNITYVDIEDVVQFVELAQMLRQPIQNAFFNDDGGLISRSLLDNIESFDFPTIVNTRSGSLIVDYIVNFNSSMWDANTTAIISEVMALIDSTIEPIGGESSNPEVPFSPIVAGSIVVTSASSCPESTVSGTFGTLNFPATPLDQTVDSQERCSEYSNNTPLPRARRTCRGDLLSSAVWEEPVLIDCFVGEDTNEVLNNIANAVVTAENVTQYSYDVAEATGNDADINAEGIRAVADALQNILNVRNSSTEVTSNTLRIVDNVLSVPDEDFVAAVDVEAPTRILDFLEQQITLFQLEGDGNNLTIVGSSVAVVALQVPEASLREGLGFATLATPDNEEKSNVLNDLNENSTMVYFNPDDIPKTIIDASIILPAEILDMIPAELLVNGTVPITFFIFQTSKLFVSPEQLYELGDGRRLAIGSRVISATVEGAVIQGLPQGGEVMTAFLELNVTLDSETVDDRTCVFWDKTDQGGLWSSEGCRREDNPDINRIQCLCDHLTSFAVLLDVSGDAGLFALDVLGMIGCIISIICLVITIVTYLSMKKLRSKQPQRILINLCFALLGLYFVFVIGIDRRYPTAGCVIVGFLIHFFLLSSMSWMLVEAVNMYLLFVKVLNANVSHFMLKASLGAYGLPLIVCIITVAVDTSHYLGDGTYCFVQPGPALYYSVLLIVALLLVINFVIFGIVIQRLSCRKSVSVHKTNQANSRGEMWRRVQNAVAISILLGLTWLFGFLAIGGARIFFNILFLVFNSLQGFFVFLMFCIRQKEVREQWVRWMHCEFGEVRPGQRSSEVQAKYKKTGTSDDHTSLATSNSQGIQLSSGGTLITDNAPSITT